MTGGRTRAVLPLENLHDPSLRESAGPGWREDLAAVTAIGQRLLAGGGLTVGLAALRAAGVSCADVEASDLRVTFFVPRASGEAALRALHAALVEGGGQ